MPCRDEHPTRDNGNWRCGQDRFRIREMVLRWPSYIQQVQRNLFLRICKRNRFRVYKWKDRQCASLKKKLAETIDMYQAGDRVQAVQEWNAAVGTEVWKLEWIYRCGKLQVQAKMPTRGTWPAEVSYMNFLRSDLYKKHAAQRQAEEDARKKAEEAKERQRIFDQVFLQQLSEQRRMDSEISVRLVAIMEWRGVLKKVDDVQKLVRHLQVLNGKYTDRRSTHPDSRTVRKSMLIQAGQLGTFFNKLMTLPSPPPTYWTAEDIQRWNEVQKRMDLIRRCALVAKLCVPILFSIKVSEWVDAYEGTEAGTYPGAKLRIAFSKHMQDALARNPDISLAEMVESWDVVVAERGEEWISW